MKSVDFFFLYLNTTSKCRVCSFASGIQCLLHPLLPVFFLFTFYSLFKWFVFVFLLPFAWHLDSFLQKIMTYGSIQKSRSGFTGSEPWVTNLAVLNEMTILQSAAEAGFVGRFGNPDLAKASCCVGTSAVVNQPQQTNISGNEVDVCWHQFRGCPACANVTPGSSPVEIPHSSGSMMATSGHLETCWLLWSPLHLFCHWWLKTKKKSHRLHGNKSHRATRNGSHYQLRLWMKEISGNN